MALIGLVAEYFAHSLDGDGEGNDGVVGRAGGGPSNAGVVASFSAQETKHQVTGLAEQQLLKKRTLG